MKIALLSNVTIEVLTAMLRESHCVWTPSGFGAWMEVALRPPSELAAFEPDLIAILIDSRFAAAPEAGLTANALAALKSAFPRAAVIAPDIAALLADLGEAAYDERMWTLAKMPWSIDALAEIKKALAPAKKVLALDLDNTLWSGVVSEDGVHAIIPDLELQRDALALKERGIILVALSKNDAEDVAPVWNDSRMILQKDDFVSMRIDWNDKSINLASVAEELNLGVDSFVFVDDNAGNRAEMRASLPEVATAAFPPRLDVYFPFDVATDEDKMRTELYKAESKRKNAKSVMSYEDYIRHLDIKPDVKELVDADIARVVQLAQKTNQMNVCSNRWNEDEIQSFAADPTRKIFTLRVSDRFGDLGLVAFIHLKISCATAEIVDWVMSCRAMNRGIEILFQREVERRLAGLGISEIYAVWRKSAKNEPSRDLFDRLGFIHVDSTDTVLRYSRKTK